MAPRGNREVETLPVTCAMLLIDKDSSASFEHWPMLSGSDLCDLKIALILHDQWTAAESYSPTS